MNTLIQLLKKVSLSWLAICIIGFFVVDRHLQYELWDKSDGVFVSDAREYYSYLPAYFIEDDMSFSFLETEPQKAGNYSLKAFENFRLIKMTSGLSILSAPFFLLAHWLVPGETGFESQYKLAMICSSLFYLLLGFFFLKKLLINYFDELTTGIVLLIVGLGTNLWYYSIEEVLMSHVFSFSLVSIFLYHTLKKKSEYTGVLWWLVFGLLVGFISLVRPTNILIVIVPIFYKRKELLKILKINSRLIVLSIIVAFLVWLPQLFYWKLNTGNWFFFSYGEEGFNFLAPEISKGLLSYRKGWFVYTPLMLLIFPGFFFLYKQNRILFLPFAVFSLLSIYVTFSWWCWWYGGSFGSRPMIDFYALYAFVLAFLIKEVLNKKFWVYVPFLCIIFCGIQLNRYQTQQYRWKIIHWDAMTKEAYFFTLLEDPEAPEVEKFLERPEY